MIYKDNKLRALVTSLVLQQVKEFKAQGMDNIYYNCEYTAQLYIYNSNFKYCNDRSNYICSFTAQKSKIM